MDLSPLLSPRTVAIIGASETGHYATSLHRNLVNAGFPIDCLFPVNPKRSQLFDLHCYPSVREIPDPIDLAVIVVPQPFVIPVAKECGEKRVRAISVISNGFAEIGEEGRKRQEELAVVARSFDLLLHGPSADPRRLGSRQVGLITISGGDCSLLSDICERVGLELPDLAGENRALIAKELKKDSFIGNPLDIEDLLQSNPDGFARAVEAFAGFAAFEAIGCRLNIPERATDRLLQSYRRVAEIVRRAGKQVFFFSRASEQMAQEWFDFFSSLEAPFLIEYEKGLKALQKSVGLGEKWRRCAAGRAERPEKPPTKVREILSRAGKNQLSTRDALACLAECDIPLVRTEIAASPDEALACADAIGYPVALKVCSAGIPHRSDIGAVRTGLRNREEVKSAYAEILSCCRKAKPEATIEGVAVQPMVQGVAEVILGISRDAQLGPVVLLGVGGIFVEVLREVVLRVSPLSLEDCREMIGALRGKVLLEGARGRPRGDLEALAKAIFSVSRLALELREEISELDLNPVMVLPEGQGVAAVDALVILRSS